MRVPTAMMVTGPGCLLTCPIVNFQAVSSTGFGLATPSELFKIAQAVAGDCVSVFQYLLYAVLWVSPWASMVASSFNLAKGIAIPMSAGTSPWAARSGMLRFVAADSATVIHLLPQKSRPADEYMRRVRLQEKKSKGIVIKPIGLLPVSKIILWIWPGVTIF